jgi:hypothetical protein
MVCKGHIVNGAVILDEPVDIPEGTPVRVELPPKAGKTLAERLSSVIGSVKGMPEDAAENHDHNLYGAPKH